MRLENPKEMKENVIGHFQELKVLTIELDFQELIAPEFNFFFKIFSPLVQAFFNIRADCCGKTNKTLKEIGLF